MVNPNQMEGAANTKATPRPPRMYTVQDTSCTASSPDRTHDMMIDGEVKSVNFKYPNPLPMPFAEAMKFLKDGFIVRDQEGNVVLMPTETKLETLTQFGVDKVIASLSELTVESLYARAAGMPGGERLRPNSTRPALISFLKEASQKMMAQNTKQDRKENLEMSEGELENMGLAAE